MKDFRDILSQSADEDPMVAEQLLPLVYDELRRLAAAKLMSEKPGQTLDATGLVHEAYLKLVGANMERQFAGRRHFFAAAAEAMRQILIDQARRKQSLKHGGEHQRQADCPDVADRNAALDEEIVLHELLELLATAHSRSGEVAKMRLCLQMTLSEIADVLQISPDTAESDWAYARAWLKRRFQSS